MQLPSIIFFLAAKVFCSGIKMKQDVSAAISQPEALFISTGEPSSVLVRHVVWYWMEAGEHFDSGGWVPQLHYAYMGREEARAKGRDAPWGTSSIWGSLGVSHTPGFVYLRVEFEVARFLMEPMSAVPYPVAQRFGAISPSAGEDRTLYNSAFAFQAVMSMLPQERCQAVSAGLGTSSQADGLVFWALRVHLSSCSIFSLNEENFGIGNRKSGQISKSMLQWRHFFLMYLITYPATPLHYSRDLAWHSNSFPRGLPAISVLFLGALAALNVCCCIDWTWMVFPFPQLLYVLFPFNQVLGVGHYSPWPRSNENCWSRISWHCYTSVMACAKLWTVGSCLPSERYQAMSGFFSLLPAVNQKQLHWSQIIPVKGVPGFTSPWQWLLHESSINPVI